MKQPPRNLYPRGNDDWGVVVASSFFPLALIFTDASVHLLNEQYMILRRKFPMRFSLVLGKLATNAHPPENAYFRGGAFPSTRTGFPSQTIPLRLFYHPISFWGAGGIFWTFSPFLLQLRFLAVFYLRVQPPTSFKSQSKDMVTDSMFQLAYKQG